MTPGRNDPCPCGSGRKYKHCCLRVAATTPDAELRWRRVRRALEVLNRDLLREAAQHFGEVGLEEAWQEFFLSDVEEPFEPDTPFTELFFSWFLHDWLPDPHGTELPAELHDTTVAQAYLARAGRRLDPLARRYVEACSASPFSFHEVVECRPGSGFRLRDVLLGSEADVVEHTASRTVQCGDCLFARLVTIDDLVLVDAIGPTAIPPEYKPQLIMARKTLRRGDGRLDADTLREWADELREAYLDIDAELYEQPELHNTDGDLLDPRCAAFADDPEVQATVQEILRDQYREWVDEKLPALGNRTPRKAVRDPDGREAVAALIAQIERDGAGMDPPLDPDIIRELRATLGLS